MAGAASAPEECWGTGKDEGLHAGILRESRALRERQLRLLRDLSHHLGVDGLWCPTW